MAPTTTPLSVVGREDQLAEVLALLRSAPVLTLVGPGGVGKSVLARMVVSEHAAEGSEGAVVVDLAGLSVAEVERIGAARSPLVVLDNCDHVLAAAAGVAEDLVRRNPASAVLVTCREPLGAAGEVVWRVPGLSLPPAGCDGLPEVYRGSEAVQLFCERAAAVQRGFVPDGVTAPVVADICRRLDGLPLAIELAASQVGMLSPAEIAEHLDRRFTVLTSGSRTAHPRHHSLRAALEWGHTTLSAPQRALLGRLSAFTGSFSLEAAGAVAGTGSSLEGELFGRLRSLVAKSLVEPETVGGKTRYRLLETVRLFAAEELAAAGEVDAVTAHHDAFYVDLARAAAEETHRPGRWLPQMAADAAGIAAAFERAAAARDADGALTLAAAHLPLCHASGRDDEARRALDRVVGLASHASPALAGRVLGQAGVAASIRGDRVTAAGCLRQGAELSEAAGDHGPAARANALAGFLMVSEDPAAGLDLLGRAVEAATAVGDGACLAEVLAVAGRAHLTLGNASHARPYFARSVEVAATANAPEAMANGRIGLGWAALSLGDYPTAGPALEGGLAGAREVGDTHAEAVALVGLGELARLQGQDARAGRCFEDAAGTARPLAMPYPVARANIGLGCIARHAGRLEAARGHLEEAHSLALRHDLADLVSPCLLGLAAVAADEGQHALARELIDRAQASTVVRSDRVEQARCHDLLGRLARAAGNAASASRLHRRALVLRVQAGDRAGMADSLEAVAGLASVEGRLDRAARLFATAQSARQLCGFVRPPDQRAGYDADLALVRAGLGAEEYDAEWAKGTALSIERGATQAARGRRLQEQSSRRWPALTPTENEVAELAAQDLASAEIARQLCMSPRTVDSHLHHIYSKLGISSRRDLAACAAALPP